MAGNLLMLLPYVGPTTVQTRPITAKFLFKFMIAIEIAHIHTSYRTGILCLVLLIS